MSEQTTNNVSFWDTCPGCGSANTAQTSSGYYHTDRHCNACGKDWRTSWEGNDDEDDEYDPMYDEVEYDCPYCHDIGGNFLDDGASQCPHCGMW